MTRLEQVCGGSLYALAKEEGLEREILGEIRQISSIFGENPDYISFLSTLSIAKDARIKALDADSIFPGCVKEYTRLYHLDNDIVEVCAVTAVPMAEELRTALHEKLQTVLGKTVELTCKVEAGCMGGVRLELPDRRLDGTVKNRLDKLAAALMGAAV